jgi:uncharacterized protein YjiS (DUF1127 family)
MTTLDTTRTAASRTFGANVASTVTALVGRVAAWNDARITRNALAQLSEHELEDIGLSRGDIEALR